MKTFIPLKLGLILTITLWTAAIAIYTYQHYSIYQHRIVSLAKSEADISYNKDLVYRRWVAKQGGVYVKVSDYTKPNPHLNHIQNRDITTTDGDKLTLVNPSYMTRQVDELAAKQYGAKGHITSLNPLRPENAPLQWEKECLEKLTSDSGEIVNIDKKGDEEFLHVIYPMIAEKNCLKCHGQQGYKVGEVRGGISISIPLAPHKAIYSSSLRSKFIYHAVVWIIGIIFIYLFDRYRKSIRASRDAALTSERKFRTLFDEAENGYNLLDFNTAVIIDCNQSFAELAGRTKAELIGFPHTYFYSTSHELFGEEKESSLILSQIISPDNVIVDVEIRSQKIDIDGRSILFNSFQDVTERKILDDRLKLLAQTIEQSPLARMLITAQGKIEQVNLKYTEITGYSLADVQGQLIDFIDFSNNTQTGTSLERDSVLTDSVWHKELRSKRKDGSQFWENVRVSPIKDVNGTITYYEITREDLTAQKKASEKMEYLANYDSLTELPNRTLFKDRLGVEIFSSLFKKDKLAVLLIDLDHFKKFNDLYGHEFGDLLLQYFGELLQSCVQGEMLARLSGNEFAIIQTSINTIDDTARLAQQILDSLNKPITIENKTIHCTCSIGISIFPDDGSEVSSILTTADMALYYSKQNDRNNYNFYANELNQITKKRYQVEEGIRNALENDLFHLNFQPQVDAVTESIVGFETLLRWIDPELGFVSPGDFIPIAEETELIIDIDKWVLLNACTQWVEWNKKGKKPVMMAINISGRQFKQDDFIEYIETILQRTGMPAEWLEIELTEGLLMEGVDDTISRLNALKKLGITISLDDFGTGYSSLRYLQQFPINILKIDKSFVDGLPDNSDNVAFTRTILSLAEHLNLKVVAEGVEDEKQHEFLRKYNCQIIQGYYFSRPLPPEELENWL